VCRRPEAKATASGNTRMKPFHQFCSEHSMVIVVNTQQCQRKQTDEENM